MKKILFIMIPVCFLLSCKNSDPSPHQRDISNIPNVNFDWLTGNWERANEEAGKQTLEKWTKVNGREYKGFGFTLQNRDTVWQENIRLINRDTIWNFEVTGKGEDKPTIFRIKDLEAGKFQAENQANEFPKIITYFRRDGNLHAVISGGGTEIPFEFVPLKNE